jgi:hypothetical protein
VTEREAAVSISSGQGRDRGRAAAVVAVLGKFTTPTIDLNNDCELFND